MLPGVEPNYNEFLYQFVGAMLGSYPDNVPLTEPLVVPAQGNVTIAEIFRYARDNDYWYMGLKAQTETPQMADPNALSAITCF